MRDVGLNWKQILNTHQVALENGDENEDEDAGEEDESADPSDSVLAGRPLEMLRLLVGAYPNWVARDELALAMLLQPEGSTFGKYLGKLTASALVERKTGHLRATKAAFVAHHGTSVTPEIVHSQWIAKLGGQPGQMLRYLLAQSDSYAERGAVADFLGVEREGSTFGKYLGKLNANGLVEKKPGMLRAHPALWLRSFQKER